MPSTSGCVGRRRLCCNSRAPVGRRATPVRQQKLDNGGVLCAQPDVQEASTSGSDAAGPSYLNDFDLCEGYEDGHKAGYVTLIGRPNVGKSTLMNSLVGQKLSIVTRKAQTTRHRILGLVSGDSFQIVFLDTPGVIGSTTTALDKRMMASMRQALDEADAVLALVDCSMRPKDDLDMIQPPPQRDRPPMAVVLNKMDLLSPHQADSLKQWYVKNCRAEAVFLTNARSGEGVEEVKNWALEELPDGAPLYPKDAISEQPERFFVSEIIREKVFLQYRQEIPYSTQVHVVDFKERRHGKDYILAEIITERKLQRAILLGKGGTAMKQLATAARADIEEFLGRPVYLDLHIRVVKDWRKDERLVEMFGYGE
eukprot:evm.model.scf_2245.5 EVM.evm.TU.scf_2245.5   scf_2245:24341-26459(-)